MLERILTDLYSSEINAGLFWLWDGGINVVLGDPDEPDAEGRANTFAEAAEWLREKAIELYPESVFAKNYTAGAAILRAGTR